MKESISKLRHNFNEYIWPGLGLFGESYLLFSIGTIRPIWSILYPQCFITNERCTSNLLHSLTYSVVIGIIIGMVCIGILAGSIGRRNGSISTALLMTIGSLGITFGSFMYANEPESMVKNLVLFLFIFGIGVGGEYPLSASSASERAMSEMKNRLETDNEGHNSGVELQRMQPQQQDVGVLPPSNDNDNFRMNSDSFSENDMSRHGRGRSVILVFSMQGMGIFVNTLTITFLLFITGQWGNENINGYYNNNANDNGNNNQDDEDGKIVGNYDYNILVLIWRIVYAFGALTLIYVLLSRILYLQESEIWAEDKKRRQDIKVGDDSKNANEYNFPIDENTFVECEEVEKSGWQITEMGSLRLEHSNQTQLFFRYYWHRLFGTSITWLLWDIAFYGNKLFQSTFLYALTGKEATLFEISSGKTRLFHCLISYFFRLRIRNH
jgi:MFS family permease